VHCLNGVYYASFAPLVAAKLHKRIKYRFFTSQIRPSMRAAGSQRVHFVDPEEWLGVAGVLCCMSWICFVSPGLGEEECP
jgi:hypothetical protein